MTEGFQFPENYLLVGKIGRAHGLKGEVKVNAFSDDLAALIAYQRVTLVDACGKLSPLLHVEHARVQGKGIVFKLEGSTSRDDAEGIFGAGILIDKADLEETGDGEYYWYQFYDLPVTTDDGRLLGTVDSIFSNGAQDIMIVRKGNMEYLIPILDTVIKEHTQKGVVITPPPGLLEINDGVTG